MKINNNAVVRIFPIPWYLPTSKAWKHPLNNPLNELIIISIVNSNVIVIVSSSVFRIIKIINVRINVPIPNKLFRGIALPKYIGACEWSVETWRTIWVLMPKSVVTAKIPLSEIANPKIPFPLTPR